MAGIQVPAQRIRLRLDVSKWFAAPTDTVTGQGVQLASSSALQFEVACYYGAPGASTLVDFANVSEVVFALQDSSDPHNGTTYWQAVVPLASINGSYADSAWAASGAYSAAAQQLTAFVSAGQNNLQPSSSGTPYWLNIYAVTTDSFGSPIPLLNIPVTLFDTGIPAVPTVSLLGSAGFTCADAAVRAVSVALVNGVWTISVAQAADTTGLAAIGPFAVLCSDLAYRKVSVALVGGAWTLAVTQTTTTSGELAAPLDFLASDGRFHTLQVTDVGGVWTASVTQ